MPLTFGKEGKKKKAAETAEGKGFGDISSWIHRIEQNVDSLEKRLDAIERRLSDEPFKPPQFGKDSYGGTNTSHMQEAYEALQQEITSLKRDIKALESRQQERKGAGEPVTISVSRKSAGQKETYAKELADIERRLERVEKRKAMVRVGKIEVPIEITGIVGGILAFAIAALLFGGYKELVVSPPFVLTIGIVLLAATGLKTYIINMARK